MAIEENGELPQATYGDAWLMLFHTIY
jgi:hypothetical protein